MPRKKIAGQHNQEKGIFGNLLNQFKLGESYTNLILGAIVVIAIGITIAAFVRNNKQGQTSSTDTESSKNQMDETTSSTYTIKTGDSLWSISEKVYKSGYNWKEIARENNLENPDVIHAGNKLNLPKIDKQIEAGDTKSVNDAISGSNYTVKKGDNLWNISVRAYGDGFRYVEIARANNLVNPSLIHTGNVFKIPRG